jgi:hypothetical protein
MKDEPGEIARSRAEGALGPALASGIAASTIARGRILRLMRVASGR